MSAAALTLTAILALATDPHCGAAAPDGEFASRLAAIAIHESGGDPLVIGVNADPAHGLPAATIHSATLQEAAARAGALMAQGRSIDLGLMQVNSGQLARHGLTLETAFDACRNMAAGADHYAEDVRMVWNLAHRRYNTGSTERGSAYAASVERVLNRVQAQQSTLPAPSTPSPSVSQPLPPPPASWDVYGQARAARGQGVTAYSSNRPLSTPATQPPAPTPAPAPGLPVQLRRITNQQASNDAR